MTCQLLRPQRDARSGFEHEQRREAHRAGIGRVCGGVDLGNVEATHPRVSCQQARDAMQGHILAQASMTGVYSLNPAVTL